MRWDEGGGRVSGGGGGGRQEMMKVGVEDRETGRGGKGGELEEGVEKGGSW